MPTKYHKCYRFRSNEPFQTASRLGLRLSDAKFGGRLQNYNGDELGLIAKDL